MPFVTEELWSKLGERANYPLITAKWPQPGASVDAEAKEQIEWVIDLVREIRSVRNELSIPPSTKLEAYVDGASEAARTAISVQTMSLGRLARIDNWTLGKPPVGAAAQIIVGTSTVTVPLEGLIDIEAEKARLKKALEVSQKEAKSLEGRLNNPSFVEKAKPEAVEKARADHAHHSAEAERLAAALDRLG
jgi:valyl-tRNA synthetase